jgi:hypothetical protein
MSSIKRGQIAQNLYSAQTCLKHPDYQTGPNLRWGDCANTFPLEQTPPRAPNDAPWGLSYIPSFPVEVSK